MKFNKKRFLKNIDNLLKERNMKISELEKKIYLSSGYFSRLRNEKGDVYPKIDTISDIADVFGVSIDYLLYSEDIGNETSNVSIVCDFIKKLQKDSGQGKVVWINGKIKDRFFIEQIYEENIISMIDLETESVVPHNMEKNRYVNGRKEYLWETKNTVWYFREFEDGCNKKVRLKGRYYLGKMLNSNEILILETEVNSLSGWDVYMIAEDGDSRSGKKAIGLYHTSPDDRPLLMKYTKDLICCIERKQKDLYISLEVKSMLDDYMNDIIKIKHPNLSQEVKEDKFAGLPELPF